MSRLLDLKLKTGTYVLNPPYSRATLSTLLRGLPDVMNMVRSHLILGPNDGGLLPIMPSLRACGTMLRHLVHVVSVSRKARLAASLVGEATFTNSLVPIVHFLARGKQQTL